MLEPTYPSELPRDAENQPMTDTGSTPMSARSIGRAVATRIDWLIGLAAAAVTVAALSPVLTTSYGFLDDYLALYGEHTNPGPLREGALLQGRPIALLLDTVFFHFVNTVGDLTIMRVFGVAVLAVFAASAFIVLRSLGYGRFPAWVFAVGMLWLPSTQVMASWAILSMGPVALVLGLLAAASLGRSLDGVLEEGARVRTRLRRLSPPVAFLSLALFSYQSAAMVFWPVMVLVLLAPVRRSWSARRLLAGAVVAGATGAVASAVAYAFVSISAAFVSIPYSRTALVTNIGGKVDYLLHSAAPRIFDPWSLAPRPPSTSLIALSLGVLVLLAVGGGVGRRVTGLGLFVVALPLSYLPSVVTAENWASARSLSGAFIVPLAATAFIVQSLPRVEPWGTWIRAAGAAAIGVLALSAGYDRVNEYFATPQHEELALARAQVSPSLANVRSPIAIVQSDYTNTLAPTFSYDEFGIPSTYASWVPVPFTQILAREETGSWLRSVRLVQRSEVASLPATTVVIDYGHLLDRVRNAVVYRGGGH